MKKVLIVEDDANSRQAIVTFFKNRGFCVESAESGAQAIDLGRRFAPEVLITDWILGDACDGITVAHELYAENQNLQIIFISGFPLETLQQKSRHIPVAAYLEKPVSLFRLNKIIAAR